MKRLKKLQVDKTRMSLKLSYVNRTQIVTIPITIALMHTFSAILQISGDQTGLRSPVYPRKPLPNPKVIGNFLTFPDQDSNPGSGERQLAVSDNT